MKKLLIGTFLLGVMFASTVLGANLNMTGFLAVEEDDEGRIQSAELMTDVSRYDILLDDAGRGFVEEYYAEYVDVTGVSEEVDGKRMLRLSSVSMAKQDSDDEVTDVDLEDEVADVDYEESLEWSEPENETEEAVVVESFEDNEPLEDDFVFESDEEDVREED